MGDLCRRADGNWAQPRGCDKVAAPVYTAMQSDPSLPCRWSQVKAAIPTDTTQHPGPVALSHTYCAGVNGTMVYVDGVATALPMAEMDVTVTSATPSEEQVRGAYNASQGTVHHSTQSHGGGLSKWRQQPRIEMCFLRAPSPEGCANHVSKPRSTTLIMF